MGMREFEMTYQPDSIDRTFDIITEDVIDTSKPSGQAPTSCPIAVPPSSFNSELNTNGINSTQLCITSVKSSRIVCSEPMSIAKHNFKKAVPVPSVSDLDALHKIFIPIKDEWMEIGNILGLDPATRFKIKNIYKISEACLREMLRNYLEKRNPLPMWQELVQTAEGYSQAVANSISRRAEYIRA